MKRLSARQPKRRHTRGLTLRAPDQVRRPTSITPRRPRTSKHAIETSICTRVKKQGKLKWYTENTARLKRVMLTETLPYCTQATSLVRRLGAAGVETASRGPFSTSASSPIVPAVMACLNHTLCAEGPAPLGDKGDFGHRARPLEEPALSRTHAFQTALASINVSYKTEFVLEAALPGEHSLFVLCCGGGAHLDSGVRADMPMCYAATGGGMCGAARPDSAVLHPARQAAQSFGMLQPQLLHAQVGEHEMSMRRGARAGCAPPQP